jgi:hypothetical protein
MAFLSRSSSSSAQSIRMLTECLASSGERMEMTSDRLSDLKREDRDRCGDLFRSLPSAMERLVSANIVREPAASHEHLRQ